MSGGGKKYEVGEETKIDKRERGKQCEGQIGKRKEKLKIKAVGKQETRKTAKHKKRTKEVETNH